MIGALGSLLALLATFSLARKRLSLGVMAVLTVGYSYGIFRANFPDGISHFVFDAALLGLYLGGSRALEKAWRERQTLAGWMKLLLTWPLITIAMSPLLPSQHVLIQFVGLRAAIWFLPMLLVGAALDADELARVGRWLVLLNVSALAVASAEYALGVDRFFPVNEVTSIIYASKDVGASRAWRIPSVFANAHAYGGTMLATAPLVLLAWQRRALSLLTVVLGLMAIGIGLFMCGARTPVALGGACLTLLLLTTRLPRRLTVALVVASLAVALLASTDERFRRFESLSDVETVGQRLEVSINTAFFSLLLEFPLGAGLGSAGGTSIPFFLLDLAKPQVGLENEFSRILVEQGLIGLFLWLMFLVWTVRHFPRAVPSTPPPVAERLMWAFVLVLWMTAGFGTGTLTSVPTSAILLIYMGALVRRPAPLPATPRVALPAQHGSRARMDYARSTSEA